MFGAFSNWSQNAVKRAQARAEKHMQTCKWNMHKLVISKIKYKPGWSFRIGEDEGRMWVQVQVSTEAEASLSPHTGKREAWRGGKRYLSAHMCRQEVVGVCFDIIKSAEDHELQEWFKYRGRAIFNPHLDPDKLADFAVIKNMNVRQNAMMPD